MKGFYTSEDIILKNAAEVWNGYFPLLKQLWCMWSWLKRLPALFYSQLQKGNHALKCIDVDMKSEFKF